MKAPTLFSLFTLCAAPAALFAQTDNILDNYGTFKPKITVSDVYSEKVVAERDDDGSVSRSVVANPEKIAFSITANLDGVDPGDLTGDTGVGVAFGNFTHDDIFSNAIDYAPGATKLTFPYTMDVDLPNGDTRTVRVGTIVYSWTAKLLTITLAIADVDGAGVSDIAASDYVSMPDEGEKVVITDDPIDLTIYFGDANGERNVFLRGSASLQLKTYGNPDSDNYDEEDVADVNVKGTADTTGPVVKAAFLPKPDLLSNVSAAGAATDIQTVSIVSVKVNGVLASGANATIGDANDSGVSAWSVTGIPVSKGVNVVAVTFSDDDGNLTVVSKTYRIK